MTSTNSLLLDRLGLTFPSRRILLSSMAKDPTKVDTTSSAYDEMWLDWELIEDLCLGRDQMILKATRWLPMEDGEKPDRYGVRLERSFLFGAFADTLERLAAKPFGREVMIENADQLPEALQELAQNVDLLGTDLTAFAKKIFKDGIKYGHSLVYVDFPQVDNPEMTLADELEQGIRPYWIHISPPNLIGWRSQKVAGKEILTQIRYREQRIVPDGPFGDTMQEVIHVVDAPILSPDGEFVGNGQIQDWVKGRDGEFMPQEPRPFTYPGIPLVWLPINPAGKGLLRSTPPLRELAEMNLEHWQKSSDKSNILRFVSIAVVMLTGVNQGSQDDDASTGGPDEILWGVNQIIYGPQGSDGKYIEHSGAGVQALQEHLDKVEEHMEMLGLQPLMARQSDVTATAQRKDDAKVTSGIQTWIRRLETTIAWLYNISARWLGEEIPEDVTFDVFNEFGLKVATKDDAAQLLQAWGANAISDELFLTEWRKRGLIGEEVDIQEEMSKAREQAMEKAELFGLATDDGDNGRDPSATPDA